MIKKIGYIKAILNIGIIIGLSMTTIFLLWDKYMYQLVHLNELLWYTWIGVIIYLSIMSIDALE